MTIVIDENVIRNISIGICLTIPVLFLLLGFSIAFAKAIRAARKLVKRHASNHIMQGSKSTEIFKEK